MPGLAVIVVTRHGHGTARLVVDSLYRQTAAPFQLIYADIGSPEPVRAFLAEQAQRRSGFVHLRFDEYVSRQEARLQALDRVDAPTTVMVDNNIRLDPGCIDTLVATAAATGVSMVSPVVLSQNRTVHYSGGKVFFKRHLRHLGRRQAERTQELHAKLRSLHADASIPRREVDFLESHLYLAKTELLRQPGVIHPELSMLTSHYASMVARLKYQRIVLLEPGAVCAITPISYGYDVPWVLGGYSRRSELERTYELFGELLGPGGASRYQANQFWHAKHVKFMLLNMLEDGRLTSEELGAADHPGAALHFDGDLPPDADARLRASIVPFVQEHHPELMSELEHWMAQAHRYVHRFRRRSGL